MRSRLLYCLLLLSLPAWAMAEPLRVAVAVAPVAWLVQQVGGDQVQVQTLVRAGQDPHAFEPAPGQLAALQAADAYLSLELPFERAWLPRVRAANPQLRVVDLATPRPAAQLDPHLWTDPHVMAALADRVADLLGALRPAQAMAFRLRRGEVAARLHALDRELMELFDKAHGRTFLVHHPAWGHLALRYGLTQLAVEHDGKEPGPRALAELAGRVHRLGIDTLFVEPQASEHLAHGLADRLGLRIVALDPLASDYPQNLRHAAQAIARALR